jgi:hypothetical protein
MRPAAVELGSMLSSMITLAAGDGRPTSKAPLWPIFKPVKGSSVCSTSFVRPLLRSASALIVWKETSGFIPASKQDGGISDLRLDGGEKDRFAIFNLSVRSFLLMLGTHVFFIILWDPL